MTGLPLSTAAERPPLLDVRGLTARFETGSGMVHAVNGISFTLEKGEALGLVGESGSGKSVSALSLLRLMPEPPARVSGEVLFEGRDLLSLSPSELRQVRGRGIAMVFQDPATSLNPVVTIGEQVGEVLRDRGMGRHQVVEKTVELLDLVGLPGARDRLTDYPHEFSGGQRQRIAIAMALAGEPSVLVADEPTTALDVTIQAQIVELVKGLQERLGMATLWITHDLTLAASLVDAVAVMYAGSIVERAPVAEVLGRPRHPYTRGLLRAMPRGGAAKGERLEAIPGAPPDPRKPLPGCPFAPRCALVEERCEREKPPLLEIAPGHASACWRWEEL